MSKKKEKTIEQAMMETDKTRKTSDEILELMRSYYSNETDNLLKMKKHTDIYDTGGDLKQNEYGRNKVILKMAKRFCKVHASYVLKDHPSITIPAKNPEDPASLSLASKTKKSVYVWMKEQAITRKLKSAVRKASYKGRVGFYLSPDFENETISFNVIDPERIAYERASDDPTSPLLWFSMCKDISVDVLKKMYPEHEEEISDAKASKFVADYRNLSFFEALKKNKKALWFRLYDTKYAYTYVNDIEVSVEEHNLPFLPFYVFPYFEFDSEELTTLIDFIAEPIKMINQVFGYRVDFTEKHSDPPLMIKGNDKNVDPDKLKGGKFNVGVDGDAKFIGPQAQTIDAEKMLDLSKAFLHFLSGLSEEAMAGFTGSLTAAGVSIELRLDSTVREALDTQVILQDILQTIIRDYLKLVEKYFPKKNLFNSKILGIQSDIKFTGSEIAGLYNNDVSFGGILPRSQDQIVRNTVTKYTTGLISQNTALEEMNYPDPALEMKKIRSEVIEKGKIEKQIQEGKLPEEKYFATPEEENRYMFESGKSAMVSMDQDHEYHIAIHESVLEKLSNELKSLIVLHMEVHKQMQQEAQKPNAGKQNYNARQDQNAGPGN